LAEPAKPNPMQKSAKQNAPLKETKVVKEEAKALTKEEPPVTNVNEEKVDKVAEPSLSAESTIDSWFEKQRRQLLTITEQPSAVQESVTEQASAKFAETPVVADVNATTSFDLWLERQKKELNTMVGTVDSLSSPVKMDDWAATLASRSQESLNKWKASSTMEESEPERKSKLSIDMDQKCKEAVQQLDRSLENMQTASSNHLEHLETNETLLEASHFQKMQNLQFSMEDRLYGIHHAESPAKHP